MPQKLTAYQLGIIYSIGSLTDHRWVFRHSEKYFLEKIQFCNSIYNQLYKGKIQYVLKMPENVIDLSMYDYSSRNSDCRNIPILDNEDKYKDFVRAYIEIHGVLDIRNAKRFKQLRLRIYGNHVMMNSLSLLLNKYIGVGVKKVGRAVNDGKTGILYYQSRREIIEIFDWCCSGVNEKEICVRYWEKVDKVINKI